MLLVIFSSSPVLAQQRTLTMVFVEPEDTIIGTWLRLTYTEAFQRMGYSLQYKHYPARRCTYLVKQGEVDGELGRIATYRNLHPSLVRTNFTPIGTTIYAYATAPSPPIHGWEGLAEQSKKVGYTMGIVLYEKMLPKYLPASHRLPFYNTQEGIQLLLRKRFTYLLDDEVTMLKTLSKMGLSPNTLIKAGTIQSIALYPHFHPRHKALVPKLSHILREMDAEGLIAKFKQQALSTLQ